MFAVIAASFVPLNFVAVRLAQAFTHPRVLSATEGNMPGSMRLVFVVAIGAIALVYFTLWRIEIASKQAAGELRRLRRQAAAEFPDDAVVPSAAAPPPRPGGFAEVT